MFSRVTTVLVLLALAAPAAAQAWTWPASGRVLRPFDYGGGTYTASGHGGVDVAGPPGSPVRAPASGQVSFAGWLPGHGKTLTVKTPDGWVVTLLHLGSVTVAAGDDVAEGEAVGTIGPTGEVEADEPYLHLGIRRGDDPHGYVDPLTLLPPREEVAAPAPAPAPTPAAPELTPEVVAPFATAAGEQAAEHAAQEPLHRVAPTGARVATRAREARTVQVTAGHPSPLGDRPRARPASLPTRRREKADRRRGPRGSAAEPTPTEPGGASTLHQPSAVLRSAHAPKEDPARATIAEAPAERDFRPPWELGIAALLALLALVAVRRAEPGSEEGTPMMDSNALLPDNTDLLREFDAAHRACVHHARGGRPRAPSQAAGRGHLLPHGHRRARVEGVPGGRGAGARRQGLRRPDRREVARSP